MITFVKFIRNPIDNAPNNTQVISRTLGKTGVISWEHVTSPNQIPNPNEFWYVRVVKEVGAGTSKGVFLLEPKERIRIAENGDHGGTHSLARLIPGTFDIQRVDNALLIFPKIKQDTPDNQHHWICSLSTKRKLMEQYKTGETFGINSVIVVFDDSTDWEKEDLPPPRKPRF